MLAFIVLALALPAAGEPPQTPNLLMPRLRLVEPGEAPPPPSEERAGEATAAPGTHEAAPSQTPVPAGASDLPRITVNASGVQIGAKDKQTYVYFNLVWTLDAAEPVAQVDGDLILRDDFGQVRGRVPWTLKKPRGIAPKFDEPDGGIRVGAEGNDKWFKGALPSSIHFSYQIRRVLFVSGKSLQADGAKPGSE